MSAVAKELIARLAQDSRPNWHKASKVAAKRILEKLQTDSDDFDGHVHFLKKCRAIADVDTSTLTGLGVNRIKIMLDAF